jgi:hypothetical protein
MFPRRWPRNSPLACSGFTLPIAVGTPPPTSPKNFGSRPGLRFGHRHRHRRRALHRAECGFIYGSPLEDMKGQLAVGALAASRLFGPQVAGIFSALMALSLMATVNAMITIGPRVYYAMAKNGAFPAAAARVHPRWHTLRQLRARGSHRGQTGSRGVGVALDGRGPGSPRGGN